MNIEHERQEEAQSLLRKLWWAVLDGLIERLAAKDVPAQFYAIAIAFLKYNNVKADTTSQRTARSTLQKLQEEMRDGFGPPETKQ